MTPTEPQLARTLGFRDAVALAFGAMVGWSWVILSGEWLRSAGPAGALLAFGVGGIVIALIALTYSELTAAMPVTGGEHAYSKRAFGRHWSFICTWAIAFGYVSVVAFEAVALPTVISGFLPLQGPLLWQVAGWDVHLYWALTGVAGALLMTWINCIGVRPAALLQSLLVAAMLLAGLLLILGAMFPHSEISSRSNVLLDSPITFAGFSAVLVMVPFLFVGFDVIPQSAGESRMPQRLLGRALVLAVGMTALWYVLIVWAVAVAYPDAGQIPELPTAAAAARLWQGQWVYQVILLAGLCGIISSWNGFIVGGSRALYAMASDGMLPSWLAAVHPRHGTPYRAIILIGVLSAMAPWFGRPLLVWLVNAGGLGVVVAYLLVALAFLRLRRAEPDMPRPYRVAAGPLIGTLAVVLSICLAAMYLPGSPSALQAPEWFMLLGWMALGALFYLPRRLEH